LREVILSELEGTGEPLSVRDFDRIAQFLDIGLADAAVEFMARTTHELDRALEQARAATQAREDVLAIVSHDLRGPLQVVYTSARIMRQQLAQGATDPLGVSLDRVERAAAKMDRLTGALLDLARLKSGEMRVQVQEERSEDLLREALEHAAPLADERAITLEIGTTETGVVPCDRERLLQVLSNLVGNAIKFTEKGGLVSISAWCASREWTFSVRDAGPGIAPERVPFIFERFWHGGGKEGGTGLGLAIAKGLVELHRGRIWVESAPGLGTTFYFTVPRAAAMGRAPRATSE
jgi:signal transduction histidine kinase